MLRESPMELLQFGRGFGQCSEILGPTSISLNTVPLVNSVPSLSIFTRISSVMFLAYEVGLLVWRKISQLLMLQRKKLLSKEKKEIPWKLRLPAMLTHIVFGLAEKIEV